MVQKVRKCPKCSGFFLLWTDVCLRCGKVDATSKPVVSHDGAHQVMDVRFLQVVQNEDGTTTASAPRPSSGRFKLPESDLPIHDMFETGGADERPSKPAAAAAPVPAPPPATPVEPGAPPRHFLVLGYRDVIELVVGKSMSLGRDPRSTLRVDRPDIARTHALLEWYGEPARPYIRDAGPEATFLNGQLIPGEPPTPLMDGAEIALGAGFKMAYRFTAALEFGTPRARGDASAAPTEALPRAIERSESGRIPTGNVAPKPASETTDVAPEGDFARTPPRAVLAHLEARGFSGVLRIFAEGSDSGMVILEQGKPKTTILGPLTGKEALAKVASLVQGTYRFHGA